MIGPLSRIRARLTSQLMTALLHQFASPATHADFEGRIHQWCTQADPSAGLHQTLLLNDMHVLGKKLCSDMHRLDLSGYDAYSLTESIACLLPLPFDEPRLSCLSWSELVDLMTTMQIGYRKLVVWNDADGYSVYFDYHGFVIFLMKRIGFWMSHEWREEAGSEVPDLATAQGAEEVDAEGWHRVAPTAVAHLLDVVHTFAALTNCLLSATLLVVDDEMPELHTHHRESSLDEFYVNAMISDVPLGSILQYAHRFQFLFHSITQVVYFHWPSYRRSNQISLAQLRGKDTPPQNILPLLLQIDPNVPVLYEHTQALCHTRRPDKWAWMNVAGFFALLHRDGSVYVAKDIRELFVYYQRRDAAEAVTSSTRHPTI